VPPEPNSSSPRYQAILQNLPELLGAAKRAGVELVLCGSVARGTDTDDKTPPSDIDFLCVSFLDGDAVDARRRTLDLEKSFRDALAPFRVDIIGTPIMFVDAPYRARMLRDSVPLEDLA